jgi:chromosome segregation ATPase
MSLCSQNNGLEPACLKQRLDEAVARADQLEQKLEDLRARLEALSTLAGQLQSIGDPQEGKADGFDNLWSAIRNLSNRLKALEKQ